MKTICACVVALATVSGAQAPVPPMRPLGPVVATSQPLAAVRDVRQLSDGRVLVNDYTSKQLLLLDSLLKTPTVILDSAGPTDRRRYGRGGALLPYIGDTTLFYDVGATALLVLDGKGAMVRIVAPPPGSASLSPTSRIDAKGRLIFGQSGSRGTAGAPGAPPGSFRSVNYSVIYGFDIARRAVDTVFWIRADTTVSLPETTPAVPRPPTSPLFPIVNGYAVMSDGTIAIVRGEDYHIEWLGADGSLTRSPRIAHEWKRLSDDDKKRMADSMTIVRDSTNKARLAVVSGRAGGIAFYDGDGRVNTGYTVSTGAADAPPLRPFVAPTPPPQALMPIPADRFPDFMPAIGPGMLADQDNRLWIPRAPTSLPPLTRVFDIVDRSGKLIDRVSVDPAHTIVGFGPGGNVYLFVRDGGVGRLQRVRFK